MADLIDIVLTEGEADSEAIVVAWHKQPGEAVAAHEPILEISTDKVTMEVAAPAGGVLREITIGPDETARPGDVLGRIDPAATPSSGPSADAPARTGAHAPGTASVSGHEVTEAAEEDRRLRLSPLVKTMLRTHSLDPRNLQGTGRGGRITHKDVQAYLAAPRPSPDASRRPPQPASMPVPTPLAAGTSRLVPHSTMRRRIADHMVESLLHTAPHVTALFDVDLTRVMAHRAAHKQDFADRGAKLTFTAYFVAAAVRALQAVPEVNSRWHDDALELFGDCNIGVATALGRGGLIVPVIHQAQLLGLFGIATKLQERTEQARQGRLDRAAVQGGTFTITNHGTSGSLLATPIINQPQSAILGIGKIEKRVTVTEIDGRDTIQITPRAYVTLTIDHRALDGFSANAFLSTFVETLESWT